MAEQKTNVLRLLDQKKIPYETHAYPHDGEPVDGLTAAARIGRDPAVVFKTLAARGASRTCYVFVIPVGAELDLKKAARSVGEKSVAMLPLAELTAMTGYVRGGCSPIGMKKNYQTVVDQSAASLPTVIVSAGKIGLQIELRPEDLLALTRGSFDALTIEG